MKTEDEIRGIVINQYCDHLSEDRTYIILGRAYIPVDMVVSLVIDQKVEDIYLPSTISMAIEYFSS